VRIVVPRFGAAIVGGAENAMRRLAEELARRSWSVEVWTTTALDEATWSPGFAAGRERDGDIEVRRFPVVARRMPWLFEQLSHGAYHLPANLRPEHLWAIAQGPFAPALIRALSTSDPVPTLFSPYLFHTTLYGIPAAPHPRILCPAAHDEPALRLGIVRRAVAGADGLWFHSPEERDLLVSVHPGAGRLPSRCGVVGIQPPPDLDAFAFAARHRITGPYLYYGGRAAGGKGLEQLIAGMGLAHAARPGLRLVLSGDASTSASAPWMIGVGRLGERERWEAIAGAAAVVVPGSMESLSLLALDAWAMGRPCLLNAASAVLAGHAARSGGGLTFDGPEQLAAGAIELLDQPDRAALLGSAGREYVLSTYRWDLAEQRLRELVSAPSR
jgi:glycosyltransferase involved in cell wall biosynthesis